MRTRAWKDAPPTLGGFYACSLISTSFLSPSSLSLSLRRGVRVGVQTLMDWHHVKHAFLPSAERGEEDAGVRRWSGWGALLCPWEKLPTAAGEGEARTGWLGGGTNGKEEVIERRRRRLNERVKFEPVRCKAGESRLGSVDSVCLTWWGGCCYARHRKCSTPLIAKLSERLVGFGFVDSAAARHSRAQERASGGARFGPHSWMCRGSGGSVCLCRL